MAQKKFNVTTFSELFVLLALVFLTQTIISFSFGEFQAAPELPRKVALYINQYPSADDFTDHIRYISVGKFTLILGGGGCGSAFRTGRYKSRLSTTGICIPNEQRYIEHVYSDDLLGTQIFQLFQKRVEYEYGVQFAMTRTQGLQNKFSLVVDPSRDLSLVEIHIGVCPCALDVTPESLALPSQWNLGVTDIRTPHPIVLDTVAYGEQKQSSREFIYSHVSDFNKVDDTTIRPQQIRKTDYSFDSENCAGDVMLGKDDLIYSRAGVAGIRSNYIRDYRISLDDLKSRWGGA